MQPSTTPLRAALGALALAAAAASGTPFGADSLLVLSVGDGVQPLGNASWAARAAPVFLTEVSGGTGNVLRAAWAVTGLTLPDNDYTQGQLTLAADGASAVFAGLAAPVGTPSNFGTPAAGGAAPTCTTQGSCFAGYARVLAFVTADGSIDTSTRLDTATYGGIVRGVCAASSLQGFLVVGNDTNYGIAFVPRGASGTTIYSAHVGASRVFTSCLVTPKRTFYTLRATTLVLADSAPNLPADLTTSYALPNTPALTTVSINSVPYYGKQIIANGAETRFWVAVVSGVTATDGGIYSGTTLRTMTLAVAATYRVTGIALSADEATVFFTSRAAPAPGSAHALWSFPASCINACTPTMLLAAAARTEFRGLVVAPRLRVANVSDPSPSPAASPSPTPTGSPPVNASKPCAAGTAGTGGVCTPCTAGKYAPAGATTCTPCAAGFYSYTTGAGACTVCPSGANAFTAANTQTGQSTCGCLGGSPGFGFTGVAPGKCQACAAGSSNPVNGSAVCVCSAPHTVWVGPAPGSCVCDIATGWSSLGVAAGAGGPVCQQCSSGPTTCPAGTYLSAPCSATNGIACSACSVCGEGTRMVSDCSATANRVCAACTGANEYAYGVGGENAAACQTCGAGSAPSATRGGCVCSDPNAAWSDATNTCTCNGPQWIGSGGGSAPPCVVNAAAASPSPTGSKTGSKTSTISISPSSTMSTGASASATGSISPTISVTSSHSLTPTVTPTATKSTGATASTSPTISVTRSAAPSPVTATPTTSPAAASASGAASRSPGATATGGGDNLGAGSGAGAAGASSTPWGTIVAVVIGVAVVAGAAGYAFSHKRASATSMGGGGGAASPRDFAPVVVASNPLQTQPGAAAARSALTFVECVDSARGVTYYANSVTGETVWALPPGGVVTQRMQR